MRSAWIVPKKNQSTLVRRAEEHGYRDGAPPLVDLGPVPMPPLAPHALDLDADTLVYAEKSSLKILRDLSRGAPALSKVSLPWLAEIHALLLLDGVVYAGGSSNGEVLGRVDLRGEARWERVDVPRNLLAFGKGIDGFALHDGRLVAVDDIVLPRYFLVYDVTNARAPRFIEARDLPAHRSAEHVVSVASNDRAMALLSTSANRGRLSVHVSLLDLAALEERAVLHAGHSGSLRSGMTPVVDFSSVALSDKTLLIAAGAAGIGLLDIDPWLSGGEKSRVVPFEELRFVPVDGLRVVDVVPVDGASAFAIVASKPRLFERRTLHAELVLLQ